MKLPSQPTHWIINIENIKYIQRDKYLQYKTNYFFVSFSKPPVSAKCGYMADLGLHWFCNFLCYLCASNYVILCLRNDKIRDNYEFDECNMSDNFLNGTMQRHWKFALNFFQYCLVLLSDLQMHSRKMNSNFRIMLYYDKKFFICKTS